MLLHIDFVTSQSSSLGVGVGSRRAPRGHEGPGWEVGRRAGGSVAHPRRELDRTLVVVESQELLRGQKRAIAVALRKATAELRKLERWAAGGRIQREALESKVRTALQREHLSDFVVARVQERSGQLTLDWHVDSVLRRTLERTRLLDACFAPINISGVPAASCMASGDS